MLLIDNFDLTASAANFPGGGFLLLDPSLDLTDLTLTYDPPEYNGSSVGPAGEVSRRMPTATASATTATGFAGSRTTA